MKTNITIATLTSIALGVFTSSCDSRHQGGSEPPSSQASGTSQEPRLPPEFAFIEEKLGTITLKEVVDKIGPYHKEGHLSPDSPEMVYEFDLPNHSALLVIMEAPFDNRNRVHRARWLANTNGFRLFP